MRYTYLYLHSLTYSRLKRFHRTTLTDSGASRYSRCCISRSSIVRLICDLPGHLEPKLTEHLRNTRVFSVQASTQTRQYLVRPTNHRPSLAASCITKVGGRKLQFSDRLLPISDRGDYGCSKVQFCPGIPPNGNFQPQIWYFWKKISDWL